MEKLREIVREVRRVGEEDPRRIVHAFKVGVALVLVSCFYYYQPFGPFTDYFGINAMWAVMTVVVVFEFSVGSSRATLSKGLNRGVATLVGGGLALGAHQLASLSVRTVEPILLTTFVFVMAALSTFVRFFPRVKERFDYGILIFILTFSLISLSGFRDEEILDLAESRLSTVGNLAEFGDEYFEASEDEDIKVVEKRSLERYKSVLNSKCDEDALANFAKWEPPHGKFGFRHPWQQYLVVAALLRQCAHRIDALNSYINSDFQISMDIKKKLEEPFRRMSWESGKAMKEASISLKKMMKSSSYDIHIINSQSACKALSTLLKSGILNDVDPLQMISLLTTVSLLNDIVNITEKISESVRELASAARFKNKMKPTGQTVSVMTSNSGSIGCAMPINSRDDDHVVTISNDDDDDDDDDDDTSSNNVDDDAINEKTEDGEIHVHTSCVHGVGMMPEHPLGVRILQI
ncbi:hypothetical protein Bca101_052677 [Brassica carinata]